MANITRSEPATELRRFDPFHELEDMLRTWRLRPLAGEMPALPEFKIDLKEDDKAYYLKADLPGMKKEDIDVTVDGNLVTITAETKREKEEKEGATPVYTERYYGKQFRRFTVRHDVDEAKAEASYADGVLELMLPKKAVTAVRHVAVH